MTMYLPNHDVRPTGSEVAEFIDGPVVADAIDAGARPSTTSPDGDDTDAPNGVTTPPV